MACTKENNFKSTMQRLFIIIFSCFPFLIHADGSTPLIERVEIKPLANIYGIHLIQYETTHRRNYIIDLKDSSMTYIGDGDVEFMPNGNIINRFKKSYFNNGGAFWSDLIRDPTGKVIKIIDRADANNCYEGEALNNFDVSITKIMHAQGKAKICVWEK